MAAKGDINKYKIQPKFPNNWSVIDFESVLTKTTILHKLKSSETFEEGIYPVVDQSSKLISGYIDDQNLLYNGDLPIVIFGDHTRNIKFIDFDFAVGADGTKILKPYDKINILFFYYYLKALQIPDFGYSRHYSIFKELDFPLPPLAEQERIVAKLDALFAQHEKMKLALDKIPQLLKDFRQQVLTQAVTGKLTEQWREGKELEEWKEYNLKDISESRLGKMLDNAKNTGIECEYLGNIDVQWNSINVKNLKKLKIELSEIDKFKLIKGDVLVCEGGEAGRAAIWKNENSNIIFQKALHRVRLFQKYKPEILLFNLELDTKSGKISELYTGTTIKHLTGQNFAKYKIKYPPLEEQQEIVSRVESLFAKADAIEARYQTLKAKIDSLPQAILHKAFKGELVQQLPTDGDAKELLAEIMQLKEAAKPKKGKKK